MVAAESGKESDVGFREHWELTFDSLKRKKFLTRRVNISFKIELSSTHLSAKSNRVGVCKEVAWSPAYRGPL